MSDFSADAGTSPSSPASFTDSLDATFDASPESEETVVQEGTPEVTDTEPPVAPAEVTPPVEPAVPETEAPEDDEVGQPKITENAKGEKTWHYPESRARILMQDRQFAQQLREAIPGITVQDASEHYASHVDLMKSEEDIRSGDPAAYDRFIQNYFGETSAQNPIPLASFAVRAANLLKDTNPSAFATVASKTVEALRSMDPKGFNDSVLIPAVQAKFDGLYTNAWSKLQQAQISGNQANIQEAQRGLYRVQLSDYHLTGAYKKAPQSLGEQPDPLASQRAEIERGRAEIQNHNQRQQQAASQAWTQKVNTQYETGLADRVSKTLENVKSHYDPAALKMIQNSILSETKTALEQNSEWKDLYDIEVKRARQSNSEPALAAAVTKYLNRAEPMLKANAKRLLPATTKAVVDANKQAHLAANTASSRRAPGTGDPVRKSIVGNPANAGSRKDFMAELNAMIPT